ncbi:MAG TPA: hypothetical protein VMK82_02055 [Steroidobacteraceae bacterium]|nr:hypothetical protein [Steroidobacteraceae bacterium]
MLGGLVAGIVFSTSYRAPRLPVAEPASQSIRFAHTRGTVGEDVRESGAVQDELPGVVDLSGHAARLLALELVGEVHREYGDADHVYRIRLQNGPWAMKHAVAELLDAGPGVQIVQGRAQVGTFAAGTLMQSRGTVTLRHGEGAPILARMVQWRMTADNDPMPETPALLENESSPAPDPEPEFEDHRDR